MPYFLKKVIYLLIPRFSRTRLYWLYSTIRFVLKNRMLVPRTKLEYDVAMLFRKYWESLVAEQKNTAHRLYQNLDNMSINIIQQVLKRHLYITENNLLMQKELYSTEELKEQKVCSKEVRDLSLEMWPYYFPTLLGAECFYGWSGLRWLPKEVNEKIKNGTFVDAGACTGDTSIFLTQKFKPINTYAFEPEKTNHKHLVNNIEKSGMHNIQAVKFGLSEQNSKAHISQANGGSHITDKTGDEEIELVRLDDFLEKQNISNVSLIKMDIEGAEMSALIGAAKSIKKYKPILAISIYHNPEQFFEIKPWIEKLCLDYKFMVRKATPFSLTGEVMLLAYRE